MIQPFHSHAVYALLASDMYLNHSPQRSPLDAANTLLTAAAAVSKLELLSGLLIERAASMYLLANQTRKYLFHEVLCGLKIRHCGPRPALHALVCISSALMLQDDARWGQLKAKMAMLISGDMKLSLPDNDPQYILLMLKAVHSATSDQGYVTGASTTIDTIAYTVLTSLAPVASTKYQDLAVLERWEKSPTFDLLQNPFHVYHKKEYPPGDPHFSDSKLLDVSGFSVPELLSPQCNVMLSVNGSLVRSSSSVLSTEYTLSEKLRRLLAAERSWGVKHAALVASSAWTSQSIEQSVRDFWVKYVEIEYEHELPHHNEGALNKPNDGVTIPFKIPLGETVSVEIFIKNPFAVPLSVASLSLMMSAEDAFKTQSSAIVIPPKGSISVVLHAVCSKLGTYRVVGVRWELPDFGIAVRQPLVRPGPFLRKTLKQRSERVRGEDMSLALEVVQPYPLLSVAIGGWSTEFMQGELVPLVLTLHNEGLAPATQIFIKSSTSDIIFSLPTNDNKSATSTESLNILPFWGQSATVSQLPESVVILPGETLRVHAWMCPEDIGKLTVTLLVAYLGQNSDRSVQYWTTSYNGSEPRTSCFHAEVSTLSSFHFTSNSHFTLFITPPPLILSWYTYRR